MTYKCAKIRHQHILWPGQRLIKFKMASPKDNEIDIDAYFAKERPGTPPQLHASNPLCSGF